MQALLRIKKQAEDALELTFDEQSRRVLKRRISNATRRISEIERRRNHFSNEHTETGGTTNEGGVGSDQTEVLQGDD